MKSRRLLWNVLLFGGISGLVLTLVLVAGNWIVPNDLPEIVLPPTPLTTAPPAETSAPPAGSPTPAPTSRMHIKITPDNVQQIVEALSRPSEYQCVWRVEWFWNQGSRAAKRQVFVRDGYTKTEIYDADEQLRQHHITDGERTFIFSPGFWQPEQGDFTADSEAALPTYETINSLDRSDIIDADYMVMDGIRCAYISFRAADSEYVDAYWLSLDDGLPVLMERSINDQPAVRCTRTSLELVRPGDEHFRLPNNRLAWDSVNS